MGSDFGLRLAWRALPKLFGSMAKASLTLHLSETGDIKRLAYFLRTLYDLYYQLQAFDDLSEEEFERARQISQSDNMPLVRVLGRKMGPKSHPLRLVSLNINSPGILEAIANLNPLKWIYEYIKLYLDYKTKQRLNELKSDTWRLKSLKEKVDLMKKANFSEKEIQEVIRLFINLPFGVATESEMPDAIIDAEFRELDE
jgi:hypothetical protein